MGSGPRLRRVWATKGGGLGNNRGGSGQRQSGSGQREVGLGRALRVTWRRLQGVLHRRGAVEDVARLAETGGLGGQGGWGGGGGGAGGAGGAEWQRRAGPDRAGWWGEGRWGDVQVRWELRECVRKVAKISESLSKERARREFVGKQKGYYTRQR